MANSITISWTKGELVSYISNLSAYVAQTLSLSGEVAFNINTLTEDNEQTFLNDKLAEGVNALVPYFSRIIADEAEVESGENFSMSFTPRIEGGSYSKAELSHIMTLCRKIVASYVLADWYSVKGVAAMNTYFATQVAQSATELNVVLDRFVRPVRKVSVNIGRVTYANKSAANYKHINNRSDFVLEWGTSNGEPLPDGEYDIDFYTDGEVVRSVNSLDTNIVKPIEGANDKVRIIFDFADGEYFGYGVLKYEMRGDILDADFPDGLRHFELSGDTSIEIWDGASDGEDIYNASYIPSYMKLTFDDLTQEDIEQLQRPALEAAEVANEAAEVANEAAERANEAADNLNFSGNYPKMSVGFAENIVGDGSATPEVFSFRPTAGENRNTLNDGAARIQVLKGSSVVVNNYICRDVSQGLNAQGIVGTFTEGYWNYSGTATNTAIALLPSLAWGKGVAGHKVILLVDGTHNFNSISAASYASNGRQDFDINTVVTLNENSSDIEPVAKMTIGQSYSAKLRFALVDLTQMFGVGNEPTTVAEFYQRKPIGVDLAAHNEGEIVNGNYEAIKTTGFNQWDEEWELGMFDTSTGANIVNPQQIRCKNPVKVIPNQEYCINCPSGIWLLLYDNNGNIIENVEFNGVHSDNAIQVGRWEQTFITPKNAAYFRFYCPIEYGSNTYNNDICINLSWDEYASMNGTYKPYKPFVRDLSWVAKYFPNGMRSAGNVADEIRFNGTTQKWEAVQRVGVRAYASGDENDSTLITDGKNTNYPLTSVTPIEITENVNLDYDCSDYGTEELVSDDVSAPLSADIVYEPNVLATIKNLPNLFARLAQMEAMVSAMAVAATNMNE